MVEASAIELGIEARPADMLEFRLSLSWVWPVWLVDSETLRLPSPMASKTRVITPRVSLSMLSSCKRA